VKPKNINYGKKLKQCIDEAFNSGKETAAMKCLMLLIHSFIASPHRFNPFGTRYPNTVDITGGTYFKVHSELSTILLTKSIKDVFLTQDCTG
jgi:hypothetical protein